MAPGIELETSGSVARNSDHQTTEAVSSGIADLNYSHDIIKQKSKHTSLVNEMITLDQQLSSHTRSFIHINYTSHFFSVETLTLLNTTFTVITGYLTYLITYLLTYVLHGAESFLRS